MMLRLFASIAVIASSLFFCAAVNAQQPSAVGSNAVGPRCWPVSLFS
jgi:hypothetical protein